VGKREGEARSFATRHTHVTREAMRRDAARQPTAGTPGRDERAATAAGGDAGEVAYDEEVRP